MTSNNRHPLDWFFLLRPTLLFPVCTVFLAGYRFGFTPISLLDWIVFIPSAIALGGAVYALNEAFDVDSDRANEKLHFLQSGIFTPHTTKIYGAILGTIGLLGLWWVAKSAIIWILLGFVVTGVLYNFPPFRFKDRASAGIVVAVLGGGLSFISGVLIGSGEWSLAVHGIPYVIAFGAISLLTQLLDTEGDSRSGKKTVAVQYGIGTTGIIAWWGVAAATIIAFLLQDWILTISAGITLLFGFRLLLQDDTNWGALTARVAILVLSISIGVLYPLYLISIIVYYFLARWYYRVRFQIHYPSLTGTNW